ncbi:MAG: circadian clock protein KaiC [Deltaproteobacteria bacterium]|nr:circadian clock protein KaiC [Deltaproteobacteria bacterium]
MRAAPKSDLGRAEQLPKAPSGIQGLDEITGGGLPRGRPTLVCGGAGCGKTLFALEFLVRGITEYGEPGVFMAFEETAEELSSNVRSLGFDLHKLEAQKKLAIDYVRVERSEIEETGEYDLEGLFVRLQLAIETVGAKRVVLDTIESLFAGLPNPLVLRSELRRLFRWLKDRGMTVVLTGEKGEGTLTRQGLEEYVSDCVIFLDHRVNEQHSTRRMRVVKYRGSVHGTNEYPFLIDETGISILPVTSLGLAHKAPMERISSGVARLDQMLGGKGYFKGSTILTSGTAGTGKTSLAALLAEAACGRGERCLFFAFEESTEQVLRNMRSIGIRLDRFIKSGLLRVMPSRPTAYGLETHLVSMHKAILAFAPDLVVVDPITNLISVGTGPETQSMMTRLIDFLKMRGTTTFFTSLTSGSGDLEQSEVGISSLIDTWLLLQVVRSGGERNRTLAIIKSRGMRHSNQVSEYKLSEAGFEIVDTYLGAAEVLTGSARLAREAEDAAAAQAASDEIARKEQERERRRRALERQVEELREKFATEDAALAHEIELAVRRSGQLSSSQMAMAQSREAFTPNHADGAKTKKGRRR